MFEKKHAFILILLPLLVFVLSAAFSGITIDGILSRMFFPGEWSGSGVNVYLILIAFIALPLAYSAASLYSLNVPQRDITPLVAPALVALPIAGFAGLSLKTLIFSAGIMLSVFYALNSAFRDKEHFKKIDVGEVTRKAAGKGISILAAAFALVVFLVMYSDPAYTESQVDSMIKGVSGMGIDDMNNITLYAAQQQRTASYEWIESIEKSVRDAISMNLDGMTKDQQAACETAVSTRISEIDKSAKQEIDKKFASGAIEGGGFDMKYLSALIEFLVQWYPIVMAITIFATLEFFRTFFLTPLAGLYGWALWRIFMPKSDFVQA